MAPILKETETAVVTTTASAPANPAGKSPTETTGRLQPMALEIPVTINGAHTVAGSDKREPFSESTQTVLVFAHGAVVRVAAGLAPGQLVFLTNEKTKKEVVCQVVKTKPAGSAGNYVELQFTEAAPGFWGVRMPAAPAAAAPSPTVVPRPASVAPTPASAPSKAAAPAIPPAPKPVPVVPKPVTPAVVVPPPAPIKPANAEHPAEAVTPSPVIPVPLVTVPPAPVSAIPEAPPVQAATPPEGSKPVESPAPDHGLPSSLGKQAAATPVPPVHDYAKEIDALFGLTPSSRPEPKPAPPAASPSSEQLKLEAARLQAQLSSLLFTETPAPTKSDAPAADAAKKVIEITHRDSKPSIVEPTPAPPARKPITSSLSHEDEVRIPAWLAPLSRNAESEPAEPASVPAEPVEEMPTVPAETEQASSTGAFHRPDSAVFGGQLLREDSAESVEAPSKGSKKGLWIGLAAAVVLLAGGTVWYLRPSLFGVPPVVSARSGAVSAGHPAVVTPSASPQGKLPPSVVPDVNPAPPAVNAAPAPSQAPKNQAARNAEPVSSAAVSAPAPAPKNAASRATPPSPEPPQKSTVGEVHLAAPVVSRGGGAQQGVALPSVDTQTVVTGDALSTVTTNSKPAVPVPIGGEVKSAQLIKSVPPVYPALARSQHISGIVQVDALIDTSGNVAGLKVLSGPPLLHRAALDAVKQWKYSPATLNGQPTEMHLTVSVQFRAQ